MTKSILILTLIVFALSGCQAKPRPVKTPAPAHGGYTPRVTMDDIVAGGGECAPVIGGYLCTDSGGRKWQCSGGGGYCTRGED